MSRDNRFVASLCDLYSWGMFVLGLIHDSGWESPEQEPEPPRPPRRWHLPWRPLAWVAVWCWLMALVPIVTDDFGGLAGYGVLLLAILLACWRADRWCRRQYWEGLREHKL
jgi:hypothetical protein